MGKHKKQVKRRLEEMIEQESYNVETTSGEDHVKALGNYMQLIETRDKFDKKKEKDKKSDFDKGIEVAKVGVPALTALLIWMSDVKLEKDGFQMFRPVGKSLLTKVTSWLKF